MLVAEGERARDGLGRARAARARRARPAGRLPGLDAAGRADRRRRADDRQGAPRRAGRAGALRRQRSARARVPGAAPPLRRQRRRARSRPGPRPRPADVAAARRGGARERAAPPRRRCATARELLRGRVPLRYRRIVVRAEGTRARRGGRPRGRRRRLARACRAREERVEVDALCVGYGFFPSVELLRVAGCELRYDEDLGGPVVVVDAWQRTTRAGDLAAGDGTGVRGSYVAEDEGRLAALGLVEDETRRGADPAAARAQAPLPARARPGCTASGPGSTSSTTPGHGRLPLRGGASRRARPGDRRDAGHQRRQGLHARRRWGSARAATASGRSRRWSRRGTGVPIADLPLATPRSPVRPVPLAAIADDAVEDLGLFVATERAASRPSRRAGPLPARDRRRRRRRRARGHGARLLPRRRGDRRAAARALGAEPRGLGHERRQLPLPDRDPPAHRARRRRLARRGCSRTSGCCSRRPGCGTTLEDRARRPTRHPPHRRPDGGRDAGGAAAPARQAGDRGRGGARDARARGRGAAPVRAVPRATTCSARRTARPRGTRTRSSPRRSSRCAPSSAAPSSGRGVEVDGGRARASSSGRPRGRRARAPRSSTPPAPGPASWPRMSGLALPIRADGLHVNVTEPRRKVLEPLVQHIGRRLTLKQAANGTFIIGGGWPVAARGAPGALLDDLGERRRQRRGRRPRDAEPRRRAASCGCGPGSGPRTDDLQPVARRVPRRSPATSSAWRPTGFTLGPLVARMLAANIARGVPLPAEYAPDRKGAAMDRDDVNWRGYWAACPTPVPRRRELRRRGAPRAARVVHRPGPARRPDQRHDRRVVLAVDRGADARSPRTRSTRSPAGCRS